MTPAYYEGLPCYMGGKRNLLSYIQHKINQIFSGQSLESLRFLDAFSGGGSVSLWAKLTGFKELHCNDISARGQIILEGLIKNNHQKLPLEYVQDLAQNNKPLKAGYVETHHGSSTFSKRHAQILDQLQGIIQQVSCPTSQQLLRLVMWKLVSRYVAYGTSIGTSNRGCAQALDSGDYHLLNPKRLTDGSFQRLLKPTLQDVAKITEQINQSIFPALGLVQTYQQDIFELLPSIDVDLAYFDPPYAGTVGYGKELSVLDDVLFQGQVITPDSSFSGDVNALKTMFDLAHHIPVWVLSYNDKVISLDELQALVQSVDPKRTVNGQAIEYAHMAHVSKRINHELLITAVKGV